MRNGLMDILKGKFLVSGDAPKNWLFIVFLSFLAVVMISSSHNADKKVHEIAQLNERIRELKGQYVEGRYAVQQLKLESKVTQIMAEQGLAPSETPPKHIKVVRN
ncbi:FtsL-like putative cell division protein [Sediminicola luteus]|jgi:cell division protein FtsL|uniref:S-adenosyl-methyltransferase n=1 Tax=Sediminicola luteus TaxID=319238 RepID=A0A2A4G6N0_9FLAO|nr:FtsL-like putative cell division protein [Sediminicola luteus]PCE63392.1 S-adenosyl-methyltransferase [Sediminicola luteus]